MRARTCCFTGHRDILEREIPVIMKRTEEYVRTLVNRGVVFYGLGGALGYDTLAAQLLMRIRDEEGLPIKLILVAPFEEFTNRWNADQQKIFREMLPKYNKVVYKEHHPSKGAYLSRDRHLVDGSAYCIAYCTRNYGGTAYTVDYARKQGLQIYNTALME